MPCAQLSTSGLVMRSGVVPTTPKKCWSIRLELSTVRREPERRSFSAWNAYIACCQAEGSKMVETVCEWVFVACIHHSRRDGCDPIAERLAPLKNSHLIVRDSSLEVTNA